MGYLQASRGLREQAEAALHSDALLVADAIDNWHADRLGDLEILARLPAIRRDSFQPDPLAGGGQRRAGCPRRGGYDARLSRIVGC